MIKIIDEDLKPERRDFVGIEELQSYLNDSFGHDGSAIKLVLYSKDGSTMIFYLASVNDEATIVIHRDYFEYEQDPDEWAKLVFEYVDQDEVESYSFYTNYKFSMIIERR